jgi:hypothetical protein
MPLSLPLTPPAPPQEGTAAFTRLSMPATSVVILPPIEWPVTPSFSASTSGCCSRNVSPRRAASTSRNQLLFRGDSMASSVFASGFPPA